MNCAPPNRDRQGKTTCSQLERLVAKVRYLLHPSPRHQEYLTGERVAHVEADNTPPFLILLDDPELYAESFTAAMESWCFQQRINHERKVKYLCVDRVVSFNPDDVLATKPEQSEDELAIEIARKLVDKAMGNGSGRLGLYVVHRDKAHLHVHFLVSLVDDRGKYFNKKRDYDLWERACIELENEYGLIPTPNRTLDLASGERRKPSKKTPSGGARQRQLRTGQMPIIQQLQEIIDKAVNEAEGNFSNFLELLKSQDVSLVPAFSGDRLRGVGFYQRGEYFKGSDLGANYKWSSIAQRTCYSDRDLSILKHLGVDFRKASTHWCSVEPEGSVDKYQPKLSRQNKNKTLYRLFKRERQGKDLVFYWKKTGKVAFRQTNYPLTRLVTHAGFNKRVVRAMMQRAEELGWQGVVVRGSPEFKQLAYDIGRDMGIPVFDGDDGGDNPPPIKQPGTDSTPQGP